MEQKLYFRLLNAEHICNIKDLQEIKTLWMLEFKVNKKKIKNEPLTHLETDGNCAYAVSKNGQNLSVKVRKLTSQFSVGTLFVNWM